MLALVARIITGVVAVFGQAFVAFRARPKVETLSGIVILSSVIFEVAHVVVLQFVSV